MPTGKNASQCSNNVLATDYCPTDYAWLIVLGLVSYLFFFAPGMGPMPWTINAEIYPLWARSLGNSLATSTNWALNLLVSMTFLTLTETITTQVKKHPIPMSLIIIDWLQMCFLKTHLLLFYLGCILFIHWHSLDWFLAVLLDFAGNQRQEFGRS